MQKKGDWNKYKSIFSRFESKHKRLKWGDSIPYNASELETALKEFYSTLNDEEKNFFALNVQHKIKEYFTATNLEPTDSGYKEYLSYLELSRKDKYWKGTHYAEIEHKVFKTQLNEQFFNHLINCYKKENQFNRTVYDFLYHLLKANDMITTQIAYKEYVQLKSIANKERFDNNDNQVRRIQICKKANELWNQSNTKIHLSYSIYK
ncbi:hypothetical protein OAF16_04645 [Flavobacteriales bacterium]|nr:hypothetical protein [Flavobacteriales bacterium]